MSDTANPQCKVRGLIARGMMCGHIIVGGKDCGFAGKCEHKFTQAAAELGKTKGEK